MKRHSPAGMTRSKKGKPFKTKSGKIEFYSEYIADEANRGKGEHYDALRPSVRQPAGRLGGYDPFANLYDLA